MPKSDAGKGAKSQLIGADTGGHVLREESMEDFTPDWCQALLKDPSYTQSTPYTRKLGESAGLPYNSLMGKTLFTDHTLRAMRFLYTSQRSVDQESSHRNIGENNSHNGGELLALMSIGAGMCSHNGTLHGGTTALLVDEVGAALAYRDIPDARTLMTMNFNINLRRPVRIPDIVLGRAWIGKAPEGRKIWVKVLLEQDGQTCIDSEILYLTMNPSSNL